MLVETSPMGLLLLVEGKVKYTNPGVLELIGIRLEDEVYEPMTVPERAGVIVVLICGTVGCIGVTFLYPPDVAAKAIGTYRRLRQFRFLSVVARVLGLKTNLHTMMTLSETVAQSLVLLLIPTW